MKIIPAVTNSMIKGRDTARGIRSIGIGGMVRTIKDRIKSAAIQGSASTGNDIFTSSPTFRYATCNDLTALMAKYPQYCRVDRDSDISHAYGLKACGTLFCVDKIVRFAPERILEIGAGWNTHFDTHFGPTLEYWMIDDASDIGGNRESEEKFEKGMRSRKHTHFVRGLLGSYLPELKDEYFDLVFSISTIEHVPAGSKRDFYKDMYRVLKPGGTIAHSIDITDEFLGRAEFEAIRQAGFSMPKFPDLKIRIKPSDGNPTLFEDFWTVFHGYLGLNRPDKWTNLKAIQGHYPTILVFGQKPKG